MLIATISAVLAGARAGRAEEAAHPLVKSDAAWRELLTSGQYDVLRGHVTEDPWTSPLMNEHRPGMFICGGCSQGAYSSEDRSDDGSGWLGFSRPVAGATALFRETGFKVQTEVRCAHCDGHHGYLLRPQGAERYVVSGLALMFHPA